MIDVVRKHLSETIDAVATKRYSDLRQIDEFVPVAKALRISRILRTLDYGGQISETLVYKDAEIIPLYNPPPAPYPTPPPYSPSHIPLRSPPPY